MNDDDRQEPILIGDFAAHINRLLEVGQRRLALEMASRWLAESPDDPAALRALSVVLLFNGQSEAALSAARQALERSPDDPASLAQVSRASFVLGRFAEAESALLAGLAIEPEDASFLLLYARLLATCEYKEEALAMVERGLESDPDDVELHQLRSQLLLSTRMSRWRLSRESAERAVRLDPDDAQSHAVLGAVHLVAREVPQAEGRFREALRIDPNDGLARRGLAASLMARKPWYRPFLAFATFMETRPPAIRWFVVLAPWALVSAVNMALVDQPGSEVLRRTILWSFYGFCAYTWFAEPIARRILARHYPWMSEH